mmetsp:Transcript_75758/g.214155  ORF Transcript_75758/g.214155 Transcript_75758/m.214155 type:complete len:250 (+) Transcript_75758:2537-3286(+)
MCPALDVALGARGLPARVERRAPLRGAHARRDVRPAGLPGRQHGGRPRRRVVGGGVGRDERPGDDGHEGGVPLRPLQARLRADLRGDALGRHPVRAGDAGEGVRRHRQAARQGAGRGPPRGDVDVLHQRVPAAGGVVRSRARPADGRLGPRVVPLRLLSLGAVRGGPLPGGLPHGGGAGGAGGEADALEPREEACRCHPEAEGPAHRRESSELCHQAADTDEEQMMLGARRSGQKSGAALDIVLLCLCF